VIASIAERLTQQKSSVVFPGSMFVSKCSWKAKIGLTSERIATMKSRKVDSAAKVAHGPASSVVTDSSAENRKSARTGNLRDLPSLRLEIFLRFVHC